MNREAQILQALATANLAEQRALVAELNDIRSTASARVAAARELEMGDDIARAHLTPVRTYARHSSETDWLGKVADTNTTSAQAHTAAKAEANRWFARTSALVREDAEEFGIQAEGYAQHWAGQFGSKAPEAADSFLQAAMHLGGFRRAAAPKVAALAVGESVCTICGQPCVLNPSVGYWLHVDSNGMSVSSDHEAEPDSSQTRDFLGARTAFWNDGTEYVDSNDIQVGDTVRIPPFGDHIPPSGDWKVVNVRHEPTPYGWDQAWITVDVDGRQVTWGSGRGDRTHRVTSSLKQAWSIDQARKIVDTGSYAKVYGQTLDLFSASALIAVYDNLSDANKAKLSSMGLTQAVDTCFKLINQQKRGSAITAARYGDQRACKFCGGDIEYHGPKEGWIDRGGNHTCSESGHDNSQPAGQKHKPYEASLHQAAEGPGDDGPSDQSQNGYAESGLPQIEVGDAPDNSNLGDWIDGDDVFGPDDAEKITAARTAAAPEGWWPLTPSKRWPGENALTCPKCGGQDVSMTGSNLGRDVLMGLNYTTLQCATCGNRQTFNRPPITASKTAAGGDPGKWYVFDAWNGDVPVSGPFDSSSEAKAAMPAGGSEDDASALGVNLDVPQFYVGTGFRASSLRRRADGSGSGVGAITYNDESLDNARPSGAAPMIDTSADEDSNIGWIERDDDTDMFAPDEERVTASRGGRRQARPFVRREVTASEVTPDMQSDIDDIADALGDVGPEFSMGDWYDPWGTAMGWAFAINDLIFAKGGTTNSTFSPSPAGPDAESYEYQALEDSGLSLDQLERAERMLDGLLDKIKAAGLDY